MKLLRSLALLAALALSVASWTVAADTKQLYHVTTTKENYDAALSQFNGELDVWRVRQLNGSDDSVVAQIYATPSDIKRFEQEVRGDRSLDNNDTIIEEDKVNTAEMLESRAATRQKCVTSTRRHLEQLASSKYVDNAFFDCFRPAKEVFAFFDALVDENPKIFTKIANITTTIEGRTVPGYKISTGGKKKPLYTQALIHSREWIAGTSAFYTMAAFLDALRANDPDVTAIFDEFEWHFVPILNLDGYLYTWSSDDEEARLWRKNRRLISGSTYGVDLNRNYGPAAFFNLDGEDETSDTYPGTAVLSEPETAGSWSYIKRLGIYGAVDMHAFGGLVLHAYGNQKGTPPAPKGPLLKTLGDAVAKAAGEEYESQTSGQMYEAYGCFDDAVFQELDRPIFTIEMPGTSFIAPESSVRPAGLNMFHAHVAFAQGIPGYWSGLETKKQTTSSEDPQRKPFTRKKINSGTRGNSHRTD